MFFIINGIKYGSEFITDKLWFFVGLKITIFLMKRRLNDVNIILKSIPYTY